MSIVRQSKFRHVFCDAPRPDATWQNLRLSSVTGDQLYIKANPHFFAVALQGGGGPFTVLPLSKPGRVDDCFVFTGHSSPVLDFEFNPFNDHQIATASEDASIKLWQIPEGGLVENISSPIQDLHGHSKKVTLLRYNPTVNGALLSCSGDHTVKLWDVESGSEINSNSSHSDLIQDIVWDYFGNTYATASKDKHIRLVDGRTAAEVGIINNAHEGAKSMKLCFLGSNGMLFSVGSTKQAQRQFKIWDPRNLTQEVKRVDIDQGAGVIMPFYDNDTGILYLAGKGDGNIRYYELTSEAPFCYPLSDFKSNSSAKGMAWIPKRGLNVMNCETARLLKLTTSSVEPLSFRVPRKAESFQADLYPDTADAVPAHSISEWMAGSNKGPVLKPLNPNGQSAGSPMAAAAAAGFMPPAPPVSPMVLLQRQLDEANARIRELEAKLAAAGLS